MAYAKIAAILVCLLVAGCDRPGLVTEPEPEMFEVVDPAPGDLTGLVLFEAELKINDETTGRPVNLADETFTYLFVYLKETGLFMISTIPFGPTEEAGEFSGNTLRIELAGVQIEFVSRGSHILTDNVDRPAWVEFTRGFEMFAPGARAADVVVGLADNRNQIPGFDRF